MNENKFISWLYVVLTAGISCVAVLFQYILEKYYLDAGTGLYKAGAVTPEAFYIYLTIAVLLVLTSVFVLRMDSLPKDLKHGSVFTSISAVLVAAIIVFSAVMFFMSSKNGNAAGVTADTVYKLRYACSVLAFPTAIYYFIVAFSGKEKSKFAPFFSFFPIVWTLVYLMSVYFDHSVLINSPIRVIQQLALIIFMVYQLFETRVMLGRSKPILYFMMSCLSVLFLASAFVPEVISLINGTNKLALQTSYYLYGGCASLYVLTRLIDFAWLCGGEKKKPIQIIKLNEELFTEEEIEEEPEEN